MAGEVSWERQCLIKGIKGGHRRRRHPKAGKMLAFQVRKGLLCGTEGLGRSEGSLGLCPTERPGTNFQCSETGWWAARLQKRFLLAG